MMARNPKRPNYIMGNFAASRNAGEVISSGKDLDAPVGLNPSAGSSPTICCIEREGAGPCP